MDKIQIQFNTYIIYFYINDIELIKYNEYCI